MMGSVQERTELCRTPQMPCVALFYLQKNETIEVQRQTLKGDWLEVSFGTPARVGWVKRDMVRLHTLQTFETQVRLQQVDWEHVFLWFQNTQFWALESMKAQLWQIPLEGEAILTHQFKRPQPWPELVVSGSQTIHSWWVFERIESDGHVFLQQLIQSKDQQSLGFTTWLRVGNPAWPVFVYPTESHLLILGRGVAPWGETLLAAVDQTGHLRWLLSKHEQIEAFLSPELRPQLGEKSLFALALDQQGYLYVKAVERLSRQTLILKLRPGEQRPWKHVSTLTWPKELPLPTDKLWPQLWIQGNESHTYVCFPGAKEEHHLFYYSVANEPIYHGMIEHLQAMAMGPAGELWTLEKEHLMKRVPKFNESTL